MNNIYETFLKTLKNELLNLERRDDVCLIAASKYYGKEEIINLYGKGQKNFGENRLQEALPKINELKDIDINWHFFGHIQTNKAKKIVEHFSCIHSVDSLKIAKILNKHALELNKKIDVFLQINLAKETQKSGFTKEELLKEISEIALLEKLNLLGLMIITPYYENLKESTIIFRQLKNFQNAINLKFQLNLKYLSMGMSRDWKEALKEGATHLRIGRALFE